MSNATQDLAAFMAQHKITGHVTYVGLERGDWDHHAFRANIDIDGEMYLHNTPYMAGTGHDPANVTVADVFGAILSDIMSVSGHEDWTTWADDLGIVTDAKSAATAMNDFREITARATLLREAIGSDAFFVLEEIAADL